MTSWIIILAVFVVFIAFSYNLILTRLMLLGAFNGPISKYTGDKCRIFEGPEACEDIAIHQKTGLAFMTCGNGYERRTQWYPPANVYTNYSYRPHDTPYVYDIKTDTLTPLTLINFDKELSLHGIGIYEDPAEPNELYLFLINHRINGSVIELFKHTLNTFELNYVKTFKHELMYNPNDVAPISKDEFYVTNDYYYTHKMGKLFEVFAGLPWGYIVFHSDKSNITEIVVDGLTYPNGIITNWDYSKIYVGTIGTGELLIYERKQNNKLELLDRVSVGNYVDNVSMDPITGELYLGLGLDAIESIIYMHDETGTAKRPGFRVIKVSNNTDEDRYYGVKYKKEMVIEDDGSFYHSASVAAVDSERKVMLIGSPLAKGFVRCELD
ncbi:hypothetical protein Glove_51g48 [Diversispora epigaea]|uniref:Arylesterase n=1 Tax=Diversispora epigaea TaxID=1348612 RepID=A0A397JDI9_9GLOM|nr:hypothetical protein Glove_51g48 [Diversispora epigaea]